jgi:CPA1 family monovalent cation:H+ antiporter
MTPETLEIVLLVLSCVLLSMSAARRLPIPYPVLLVIVGLLVSLVPGLPSLRLDPDLVFFVFLLPVLWAAAYLTSWRDFRNNVRPITLLAVGLVVATTAAVALCGHSLIRGISWPGAVALGAIESPPDAVSAVAVVGALGVPRRVVTILEGESLVNDATALILYRAAVGAMIAGTFNLGATVLGFFAAAAVGITIGLAVGWLAALVHRLLDDPPTLILVTLMAPYLAWILGDRAHASAVLACVAGGLTLRRSYNTDVSPVVRLQARPVWILVTFTINGVLFLLIGLQLRSLASHLPADALLRLMEKGALLSALIIAVRLVWVPLAAWLPRFLSPALRQRDPMPENRALFLIGWVGLHGIVSLAGAMALPLTRADGSLVPYRSELILITFVVIFCTLVVQGSTLAPVVRFLRFPPNDEAASEERKARSKTARSALARLQEISAESWADPRTVAALREQYQDRLRRVSSIGASSLLVERGSKRARFERLMAERLTLVRLQNEGMIGDEVFMELETEIDLEAARYGLADLRDTAMISDED